MKLIRELLLSLPRYGDEKGEEKDRRINALLKVAAAIGPRDAVEAQLASQMITAHGAVMQCLTHAATGLTGSIAAERRESGWKHAAKFMQIYMEQMRALQRHRGRDGHKMTVEHVHVAPGGQAIVGMVTPPEMSAPIAEPEAQTAQEPVPVSA